MLSVTPIRKTSKYVEKEKTVQLYITNQSLFFVFVLMYQQIFYNYQESYNYQKKATKSHVHYDYKFQTNIWKDYKAIYKSESCVILEELWEVLPSYFPVFHVFQNLHAYILFNKICLLHSLCEICFNTLLHLLHSIRVFSFIVPWPPLIQRLLMKTYLCRNQQELRKALASPHNYLDPRTMLR